MLHYAAPLTVMFMTTRSIYGCGTGCCANTNNLLILNARSKTNFNANQGSRPFFI